MGDENEKMHSNLCLSTTTTKRERRLISSGWEKEEVGEDEDESEGAGAGGA